MPTVTSVPLRGVADVERGIERLIMRQREGKLRLVQEELEAIMTLGKIYCPVDTGALRGSGHVTAVQNEGGVITGSVVFGGAAAPYAVIVHEDTTAHHNVGQSKYLERALLDRLAIITQAIEEDYRAIFRGVA